MYGQTPQMYKTLVDAYHTVLLRMREKNLVLPMAMMMVLCGGMVAQKAGADTVLSPRDPSSRDPNWTLDSSGNVWQLLTDNGYYQGWGIGNFAIDPATSQPYPSQGEDGGQAFVFQDAGVGLYASAPTNVYINGGGGKMGFAAYADNYPGGLPPQEGSIDGGDGADAVFASSGLNASGFIRFTNTIVSGGAGGGDGAYSGIGGSAGLGADAIHLANANQGRIELHRGTASGGSGGRGGIGANGAGGGAGGDGFGGGVITTRILLTPGDPSDQSFVVSGGNAIFIEGGNSGNILLDDGAEVVGGSGAEGGAGGAGGQGATSTPGGRGGDGAAGGRGGYGILITGTNSGSITLGNGSENHGLLSGGMGQYGGSGGVGGDADVGGRGGDGGNAGDGSAALRIVGDQTGTITLGTLFALNGGSSNTGGRGGDGGVTNGSGGNGGNGGNGAEALRIDGTLSGVVVSDGRIQGGSGGGGGEGGSGNGTGTHGNAGLNGNGGVGIWINDIQGGKITITNDPNLAPPANTRLNGEPPVTGEVLGGNGGYNSIQTAGNGGDAIHIANATGLATDVVIDNAGMIGGGLGGGGQANQPGGMGGRAIYFSGNGTIKNSGIIYSGYGQTIGLAIAPSSVPAAIQFMDGTQTLQLDTSSQITGGIYEGNAYVAALPGAVVSQNSNTTIELVDSSSGATTGSQNMSLWRGMTALTVTGGNWNLTGSEALATAGASTGYQTVAVSGGATLNIDGGQVIGGDVVAVSLASGAALGLDADAAIGSLTGAGNVAIAGFNMAIGTDNTNTEFSGVINGYGSLEKKGAGTTTLSGANTYGTTTVTAGKLVLDYTAGSNRLSTSSSLSLNGGELQFDNLGANTQTFDSTNILSGASNKLTLGAGRTTGTVDLGSMTHTAGSVDVSDIGDTASWLQASGNQNQSNLLSGAVTANGGTRYVATDSNGFFILVPVSSANDFSQGGAITNLPGQVVRLISSGTGGDVSGAAVTLADVGTTDVDSILNAYAVGNPSGSPITLDIGSGNTLRLGAAGGLTAAAGTDLIISNGMLTAGGAANTDGTITVNATNNITVNAIVADNGTGVVGISKTGSGTLVFTGANTYSGTTNVGAGTLIFDGDNQTNLGALTVLSGATLGLGQTNTSAFSFGDTLTNGGILNIRRNLAGTGAVVNNGILTTVNNLSIANAIANNAGSAFNAVGNTLSTGDLTFAADSTLMVDGHTRITATNATVAAGAKINASTNGFTLGQQVPIITTSGAVTGATEDTFDATPSEAAPSGYRWVSASDSNHVFMGLQLSEMTGGGGGSSSDITPQNTNAQSFDIAAALDRSAGAISVNPDIQEVYAALHQPGAPVQQILEHLAGHTRATFDRSTFMQTRVRTGDAMRLARVAFSPMGIGALASADAGMDSSRATCLSDLAQQTQAEGQHWRFFAYGSHTSGSKPEGDNGAAKATSSSNGFTVGANNQIAEDWNIGLMLGFDDGKTSSASGAGTTDATSYSANFYAAHTLDVEKRWVLSGSLGFSITDYDSERLGVGLGGSTATSSSSGSSYNVAVETGYKLDVWEDAQLMPLAGLSYVHSTVGATTETLAGASGLALGYDKSSTNNFEATLGVELAQRFQVKNGFSLTPSARLAWHHLLNNGDGRAVSTHFVGDPANSFNTYLQNVNSDALSLELGLTAQWDSNWKVFANVREYKELGSDGSNQVGVGAGVAYSF